MSGVVGVASAAASEARAWDGILSPEVLAEFAAVVGAEHVATTEVQTSSYTTDFTRRFIGHTPAVIRPGSTEEVAAIVAICGAHGIPVVPQGGLSGLVGGSVPMNGEVVILTTRLLDVGPVDLISAQVTVGAGVTLAQLHRIASGAGLDVGIDFAARESATAGGLVATNAGGETVLRFGSMRAQVAGLTAVLADGSVIRRLAGLAKDNTGYDLVGLFAASEGTLGIITEVRVQLQHQRPNHLVLLAGLETVEAAQSLLAQIHLAGAGLESAELFLAPGLALVRERTGLPAPMSEDYPVYLLLAFADAEDPTDRVLTCLETLAESLDGFGDVVVGMDAPTQKRLWEYREFHTESVSAQGIPVKLDVGVPAAELAATIAELPGVAAAAWPSAQTIIWSHINEANLHVNILGVFGTAPDAETEAAAMHAVESAVLGYVTERGGSISAEHGVGRAKAEFLHLSRSPAEIAAMRAIKSAMDPQGLMNPGVILQ